MVQVDRRQNCQWFDESQLAALLIPNLYTKELVRRTLCPPIERSHHKGDKFEHRTHFRKPDHIERRLSVSN
jgi:hypothetical protein